MEEMHDEYDPKDLIDKEDSCIICFGLHRLSEPLQIETKDSVLDAVDDIDENFPHLPHPSKRNAKGFSCEMPGCVRSIFLKYTSKEVVGVK